MSTEKNKSWQFDNTYIKLPFSFYKKQLPTPISAPQVAVFNESLAKDLGLDFLIGNNERIAEELSGNSIPNGSDPIAQAYAGHQFGHFTMLGDGRAILLGEILNHVGERVDIQLKGAGQTPYSRRGDGRATLRSMLREYIMSEAMHHLGIPTSRSLAVISTSDPVYRQQVHSGAVLTRVMSSHIRVGTFEYARQFGSGEDLQALAAYTIERHYPSLSEAENPALELLRSMLHQQTDLVLEWLRVGFIHGVMNTDNMGLACETYDYGPCAFMNAYHPKTVFSSIDTNGRYAFENQPFIAHWNVSVLAGALLPLIDDEQEKAIALAQEVLNEFEPRFIDKYFQMMLGKIGLSEISEANKDLLTSLLGWMEKNEMDYTKTFYSLLNDAILEDSPSLKVANPEWYQRWQSACENQTGGQAKAMELLKKSNPAFIPRNHAVEYALDMAESGNYHPFHQLLEAVLSPYEFVSSYIPLMRVPPQHDQQYATYCGT
jgi:uncharacterized protein YdiU (UPF0061 family)